MSIYDYDDNEDKNDYFMRGVLIFFEAVEMRAAGPTVGHFLPHSLFGWIYIHRVSFSYPQF